MGRKDPDAPRKRVSAPERRARILEVARSTFLERGEGINGVSMRLIAERGGIDEALIYRHFGSKENLYSEVVIAEVKAAVERLLERTRALAVGELSEERERREWQLTHEFVLTLLNMPPEVLRAMGSLLCGERSHGVAFYRGALAPALRSVEQVVEDELRNWAHPPFSPPLAVRVTVATCLWHVLECDLATDGAAPDSDGAAPDSDGAAPDSDGAAPDSDGVHDSAGFARELTDLVFYGITATGPR
ncbi:MAG TPA: TetR/AcrR family transcriptional regulator [Pseudonocardia sp.]|nr:TetR/AcrR family transcriptional regulator [Pseudonocardia sp.]